MKKAIVVVLAGLLFAGGSVCGQELHYTGNETFQGDGECYQIIYDREGKILLGKKVPCPAVKRESGCYWEIKRYLIDWRNSVLEMNPEWEPFSVDNDIIWLKRKVCE